MGLPSPLLWRSGHIIGPGVGGGVQARWSTSRAAGGGCGGAVTLSSHQFSNTKSHPKAIELISQLAIWKGKGTSQTSLTKPQGANFHLIPQS